MIVSSTTKRRTRGSLPGHEERLNPSELFDFECPEDVRAATILAWASQNGVSTSKLSMYPTVRAMLDAANGNVASLASRIGSDREVTLKQVEGVFESVIDKHRKKKQGAVYTPDFIIDYLIKNGLRFAKIGKACPRFCDPACGSGGFLIRAAEILAKRYRLSLRDALLKYVRGIDNDEWAVEHAKSLLSLHLLLHGSTAPAAINKCVFAGDTLLSTADQMRSLIDFKEGVDLLATNPPYVKLQNLDRSYRSELVRRYSEFATGSFSLALLFLIAGHRMLSPNGVLAYITQNNIYTSLSGKSVRAYLQSEKCIRRIIDFNHERIFPDVSAYTCLIFLSNSQHKEFDFEKITGPVNASTLNKATFSSIRHDALDESKWRLAKQPHLDHLHRIERIGIPLGKLTKISVGFATLKDAVFHLKGEVDQANKLFHILAGGEIELGATKRALKIAEMETEQDVADNQRRIIFPYERRQSRWRVISEVDFKNRFPKAYRYLVDNREALATRDKGRCDYEAWYAWARTQGRESPGPKLLTKTFSPRPNFLLDESDQLFCNGYSVSAPRTTDLFFPPVSITCLHRILNSSVMYYYAKLTSFQIEGDYQCYQKNFIERFGIPELSGKIVKQLKSCPDSEVNSIVEELYGVPRQQIEDIIGGERDRRPLNP